MCDVLTCFYRSWSRVNNTLSTSVESARNVAHVFKKIRSKVSKFTVLWCRYVIVAISTPNQHPINTQSTHNQQDRGIRKWPTWVTVSRLLGRILRHLIVRHAGHLTVRLVLPLVVGGVTWTRHSSRRSCKHMQDGPSISYDQNHPFDYPRKHATQFTQMLEFVLMQWIYRACM